MHLRRVGDGDWNRLNSGSRPKHIYGNVGGSGGGFESSRLFVWQLGFEYVEHFMHILSPKLLQSLHSDFIVLPSSFESMHLFLQGCISMHNLFFLHLLSNTKTLIVLPEVFAHSILKFSFFFLFSLIQPTNQPPTNHQPTQPTPTPLGSQEQCKNTHTHRCDFQIPNGQESFFSSNAIWVWRREGLVHVREKKKKRDFLGGWESSGEMWGGESTPYIYIYIYIFEGREKTVTKS